MKNDQDQWLLLDRQLCFPLYACARKIVAAYHPYLKKIGLTYTQYITMMVLWQEREISVKDLGTRLYLDSGTLTPVLKTLERLGYVARTRSKLDERVVVVLLSEKGAHLKEKALSVPEQMSCQLMQRGLSMTLEEAEALKKKLYEILACLSSRFSYLLSYRFSRLFEHASHGPHTKEDA